MQLKNRIVLAFNRFYSNLLKDLKTTNDANKTLIKRNYKVFDKLSSEYIVHFRSQFEEVFVGFVNEDASKLDDTVLDLFIVKDITIKMVMGTLENDVDKDVFWNYVYILTLFALVGLESN